jgi:transposase-like protein
MGKKYPIVINSWKNNWAEIISQFAIIFDERLEKYL